ncbi:MAG: flagellar basal body rod protein FlgB [Gammaproteobacteria bacterium]|nr:flagellar basal body rod protein FlgB [Gammaproteobacteria bacterium]MDH5731321.1 flagellar basal body rod protein FlgB [Gammaproteobacteria bacterium]
MRFDLDKAMGIHEQALYVRSRRSSLIASNLANADTPFYKAQDIDFKDVLGKVANTSGAAKLEMTSPGHLQPGGMSAHDAERLYRHPFQASIDGNTVDAQMEKSEFAQNAVMYQTSLNFLTGKFKSLKSALKGESQ